MCQSRHVTVELRLATQRDGELLLREDHHVRSTELSRIIDAGRVLVAAEGASVRGWLRWGLFWDSIPFMNLLFVLETHRRRGLGTRLMQHWESAQRADGFDSVMTSTLADEEAQHLYRRLGYVDCGCLLLDSSPLEIFLMKRLAVDSSAADDPRPSPHATA